MNPAFYVAYPTDNNIKLLINAIRVIADENQRTQGHITVRGPYKKRLTENKENEFSSLIKGEKILINNIGNFFDFNQNTVFFKCDENENLKKIWMKTSYKEYNPHITIYNGKDSDFAHNIHSILLENFTPFCFRIEKISWLEPKDKEKLELFHLKSMIDFDNIAKLINYNIDSSKLINLSKSDRLKYISILSKKLYEIK